MSYHNETVSYDTSPPTVAVTTNAASLSASQTALITFTLSELSTDFVVGDVAVSGGTLSNFSGSGSLCRVKRHLPTTSTH